MHLWRLARMAHTGLDGEGARRFGGRWNSVGRPVVYCAANASLVVLEVRVHLDLPLDLLPDDYRLLGIETGEASVEDLPERCLPSVQDSQVYGDAWLASRRTALLRVPSVIIPEEKNVLLNPLHPDAQQIHIISDRAFGFDPRLF